MHGPTEPAALLRAETLRLREAAALGPVLDVACGSGRNALPLARDGIRVIGLDRSRERLGALA
ncbi:MAG: class I SAM-dependent methyltransferase, partial [Myxococcota bacterium]